MAETQMTASDTPPTEDWAGEMGARWLAGIDQFESMIAPIGAALLERAAFRTAERVLDLGCSYGLATHWMACFTDGRTFLGVDYDEEKSRVAQRSAPEHPRMRFEVGDILEREYAACDTILLLDVLHYWTAAKQQIILNHARAALRPGGRLVLRDGARAEGAAHRRIHRWEKFATRVGMNRTQEGLHFQTRADLEAMLRRAGFARWEIKTGAGKDSNVMILAFV